MICKNCSSEKVVKNGLVRGIQRYKCKDCGDNFVEGDRRTSIKAQIAKAINTIFNSFDYKSGIPYNEMSELLGCDRKQIYRWNSDLGNFKKKYGKNIETIKNSTRDLNRFMYYSKNYFEKNKPVFFQSGTLLDGEYTAVLIIQKNEQSR